MRRLADGQLGRTAEGLRGVLWITLDPRAARQHGDPLLLHEWVHALEWREWTRTWRHGPRWGRRYARLYSDWLDSED